MNGIITKLILLGSVTSYSQALTKNRDQSLSTLDFKGKVYVGELRIKEFKNVDYRDDVYDESGRCTLVINDVGQVYRAAVDYYSMGTNMLYGGDRAGEFEFNVKKEKVKLTYEIKNSPRNADTYKERLVLNISSDREKISSFNYSFKKGEYLGWFILDPRHRNISKFIYDCVNLKEL